MKFRRLLDIDDQYDLVPLFFIKDSRPKNDDYILITNARLESIDCYSMDKVCILSDKDLSEDIGGISLSPTMGRRSLINIFKLLVDTIGQDYGYRLYQISKDNYDYINDIKKQLDGDGGIYNPLLATPRTNIEDSHIYGQFIVSDVAEIHGVIAEDDVI